MLQYWQKLSDFVPLTIHVWTLTKIGSLPSAAAAWRRSVTLWRRSVTPWRRGWLHRREIYSFFTRLSRKDVTSPKKKRFVNSIEL
jgi:hypothetical protein